MYLKSLTLKGFKSFADRTQLSFDPGLNVIVGPNGSGKSNVSDSVLWVLGEQSAKQLRGQAMEDVIFSGSSARKAVGLAEVTLVLDNSDRTLPVEFDEVGITRRMYRSGESEYLINASPARLMDIRDILHDSGLGRETSSIISQGKLDAVLQARPEERRALVEEAAGIAKHKRRKERSQKKLASMDENIRRAKDISREITRRLRPLERQVDKAQRAQDLTAAVDELAVLLAVDDLRRLQRRWDEQERNSKEANAAAELARYRYTETSSELEKLQLMLEQKGLFVGDLGEQRRRMQDVLGRLDSDMRLLEEKGRNMVDRLSDARMQLSSLETTRQEAQAEHERVHAELDGAKAHTRELEAQIAELTPALKEAQQARRELGAQQSKLTSAQREAQRKSDSEMLAYAKLRDQISNAEVEDQMFASRLAQIEETLAQAELALKDRANHRSEVEADLERMLKEAQEADAAIGAARSSLDEARVQETEAREALGHARADLSALRAADERAQQSNPLVASLAQAPEASLSNARLSDLIEVGGGLEGVVERLLGEDLAAFVAGSAHDAASLAASALALSEAGGYASIAYTSPYTEAPVKEAAGEPLLSQVKVVPGAEGLVQRLLGNVYVVKDVQEAIDAHERFEGLTFIEPSGAYVLPDGRIRIQSDAGAQAGALERKRSIRALEAELPGREEEMARCTAEIEAQEAALNSAREASASAKGEIARLRGELSSVTAEVGRLEQQLNQARTEQKQVSESRAAAAERARAAREEVEQHRTAADEATALAAKLAEELEQVNEQRIAASRAENDNESRLSQRRLELATVAERRNNLSVREEELERRVKSAEARRASLEESARALDVLRLRVDPLHERYEQLREVAEAWAVRLRDRASLEEASSDSLKKTIAEARTKVAEAQKELDAANEAVSDAKVASGKLEVEVKAAVAAIAETGHPLEEALELPEPEDREQSERELAKLRRQLADIGPVNQVAMEEYETLKARADYIEAQLDDLQRARASLQKITAALDRKMRAAFLVTYEKVDENFREIFSMLFPGGNGNLVMTDPEHPDETGIEVVAQPRGKRTMKMTLLSGGERSLTALALLFAIYRARTTPFYIFDEVEAALDDTNLDRLLGAIELLKENTQLIVITHQRRTMEQADVLYGVSMQADGVSQVLSQRLDRTTGKVVDSLS